MKSYIVANGVLLQYRGKAAQPTFPKDVTEIGTMPFLDCDIITSIKIPNRVTNIHAYAFYGIPKVKAQFNSNGSLRAFKAFNEDWTCRKFQYEVGKAYHLDGNIECCKNGFHACENPLSVFNYYYGNLDKLHFAEVELSGKKTWEEDKVAASDIKIIRELTASELAEIYNSMEKV